MSAVQQAISFDGTEGEYPADPAPKTKPKHNRSRGGCTRCRQRRQKCDELKPACSRCQTNGFDKCTYTVNLQWGGRNFQSYAKNTDIKKYETEPGTFVYVASSKQKASSDTSRTATSPSPSRSISPLDTAKPLERLLLHHFASEAILITSCHPSIQNDFCQLLLPMAFSYPPLLSALMALSAIHRSTLYNPNLSTPIPTNETMDIISLKASSISKLRNELLSHRSQLSNSATKEAVLATALTLCMCEIHSGADQPRSWRLHLEGAKAILSSRSENEDSSKSELDVGGDPTSQSALLERWYISIEALAAITAKGLKTSQSSGTEEADKEIDVRGKEKEVYLDDYFGFSTDLAHTFKDIGAAAWERRSQNAPASAHTPGSSSSSSASPVTSISEVDLEIEAANLETSIRKMLARDEASPPKFYAGVREKLDDRAVHEFYLCNEMYQHAALIHIYRRVRCLPRTHHLVQISVQKILECVRGIRPRGGLSPYIVLTMPLFTAGRELLPDDMAGREEVRYQLSELADKLKLRNVWRSLEFLELEWENGEIVEDGEDCDFIPY